MRSGSLKKVYELGGRSGVGRGLFEFTSNHGQYLYFELCRENNVNMNIITKHV